MTLKYVNESLTFDNIDIQELDQTIQTPYYLYSKNTIDKNVDEYISELKNINSLICYSVKANSNLSILSLFAKKNLGFDIVSGGELHRVIRAGGDSSKVVFSGVGKTDEEIEFALKNNIYCFNVESQGELSRIDAIASLLGVKANISLRVNPEIDANTHPYITTGLSENKFGISQNDVLSVFKMISNFKSLNICGIDYHIGSQIVDLDPFIDSANKVLLLINELEKEQIDLLHVDLGGGLGIGYNNELPISRGEYVRSVSEVFKDKNLKLIFEPGRSIVGNTGLLISQIIYIKEGDNKNFIILDAAMNDFMRPALYNAKHRIIPLIKTNTRSKKTYEFVGPICESTDKFLTKKKFQKLKEKDFIAICDVGAYGMSLSSNYNLRPKATELLIKNSKIQIIYKRQSLKDLI